MQQVLNMRALLYALFRFPDNGDSLWANLGEEEQEGMEAGEQGVGGARKRGAGGIGGGGERDPEMAQFWRALGSWTSE